MIFERVARYWKNTVDSGTQCILFSKVFNFRVLTELGKIPSVHFMIFLRIVVKDHFQLLL